MYPHLIGWWLPQVTGLWAISAEQELSRVWSLGSAVTTTATTDWVLMKILVLPCLVSDVISRIKKMLPKLKAKLKWKAKVKKVLCICYSWFLSSTRNSMTTYLSTVVPVYHEMSQKRRGACMRLIEAFKGVGLPCALIKFPLSFNFIWSRRFRNFLLFSKNIFLIIDKLYTATGS